MRRREFITLLGGAAAAWPLATRAQQTDKVTRIGFLGASRTIPAIASQYQAFLAELRELGFVENQNLVVAYRNVDDPRGPFVAAAELMRSQVELIVASGPETALQAVVGASGFIPIVIQAINYDPIERGYVTSLARSGGDALSADQFSAAEQAARSMPLELRPVKMEKPPYDFPAAFRTITDGGAQMVLVLSSPHFSEQRPQIGELVIRHRLPSMFIFKAYVVAGGLMSYGVDQMASYRRTATYVAKILKGAKPADLPIEQPTKFELVVNLKTAKAIGVDLPTSILLRADEVIE